MSCFYANPNEINDLRTTKNPLAAGRGVALHKMTESRYIYGMPILFRPKPGCVLFCDFRGYIEPEMIKSRPVVVISPSHMERADLVTVVPLSTTPPNPVQKYHYKLIGNPIPGNSEIEVWAKCDMVATVAFARLDRVKLGRGNFQVGAVSIEQVKAIRRAALVALGVDLSDPRTYT